jgi:hypothetical protein
MAFFIGRMEYNGCTMKRLFLPIVLLLTMLLVACGPQAAPDPATRLLLTASPTPTAADLPPQCAYSWATRSLPDLSKKVQALIDADGLKGVRVNAEAYGEDCYDTQADKVVSFGAMETDFRFTVQVDDLNDKTLFGDTVRRLLKIINALPRDEIPGPMRGYIGVTFTSGTDQLNMWFLFQDGLSALDQGLSGSELFEQLLKK